MSSQFHNLAVLTVLLAACGASGIATQGEASSKSPAPVAVEFDLDELESDVEDLLHGPWLGAEALWAVSDFTVYETGGQTLAGSHRSHRSNSTRGPPAC